MTITNELLALLDIIPDESLKTYLINNYKQNRELIEVIIDLNRSVELRFLNEAKEIEDHILKDLIASKDMIEKMEATLDIFNPNDRVGINGTLHRVSRIQNKRGATVGFTLRVGKVIDNSNDLIKTLIDFNQSTLILGAPGTGKTSCLRNIANILSETKRVIIIDSANEIGGEGDSPHPAIGLARRMQIPYNKTQAEIMIRAVENHNPEVIIIDEISTEEEARVARSISARGVQLIATAHGNELADLFKNIPLQTLVGSIKSVTLSDVTAQARGLFNKSVLERAESATFDRIIELVSFDQLNIYSNTNLAVDALLANFTCTPATYRIVDGRVLELNPESIQNIKFTTSKNIEIDPEILDEKEYIPQRQSKRENKQKYKQYKTKKNKRYR